VRLTVVLCVVLFGPALAFAAQPGEGRAQAKTNSPADPGSSSESALAGTNQSVPVVSVPDAFKTCAKDTDCTEVSRACRYCCDVDAINIKRQVDYKRLTEGKCKPMAGSVCGCPQPAYGYTAVCVDGICRLRGKTGP
jgi:hypothetical protein